MGADYWLETVPGDGAPIQLGAGTYITYNLEQMLREADPEWDWRHIDGMPANAAMRYLRGVSDILKADPERFKALNPPNGWGSYDVLIEALEDIIVKCAAAPNAVIGASL